jgi:hypothetical protein
VNVKALGALLLCTAFLVLPPQRAGAGEREAGFYVEETGGGLRFIQRFSREPEGHASCYEVVIQRREGSGNWAALFSEFTGDNFIEVSLPPGSYCYHVRAYDLTEKPAGNPGWASFEVLPATRPVLERFSSGCFSLGGAAGEGAVLILTVGGQNLTEAAEFRLVRQGPAGAPGILPLERRGDASGKAAFLVFGGGQLSPGNYELRVVNPGGLSDSLGTLRIYPPGTSSLLRFAHKISKNRRLGDFYPANCVEPKLRGSPVIVVFMVFFNEKNHKNPHAQQAARPEFDVSPDYEPLIPLYGRLHELLGASFFPAGARGRFSFLSLPRGSISLGLETDISWAWISSRYGNRVQEYAVSGHYLGIKLYGSAEKTLNRRLAIRLRLGGGIFSILGFEKRAPGLKSEPVNALVPVAGGELSIRLALYKSLFADLGAEYTHFFSTGDSPPGYLRPFWGIGFSW